MSENLPDYSHRYEGPHPGGRERFVMNVKVRVGMRNLIVLAALAVAALALLALIVVSKS